MQNIYSAALGKIVIYMSTFLLSVLSLSAQKIDTEKLQGLKIRNIGPAGMSGRVTSIDAVTDNPDIIYVGTASGGLWKSESGGIAWQPIFEHEKAASIGAVAINQQNPDVIWAGTGEGNPRNSQSSGYGIYKSLDGGKNWQLMGLENTRNIHKIIINKHNPDIVYAGVQGSAWGAHPERGVYKTTDGGETWEKVLFVNDRTGVADMVVDPSNPDKLVVALWHFQRDAWYFKSGGEGSGLYITIDGGKNWKKQTEKEGFAKGELGRMGLAVAPSNPDIIYALVEAEKNALYKSTDGGVKWMKVSDKDVGNRPFYYSDLYVDPKNENRLYNVYGIVKVSEDGGKTFSNLLAWNRKPTDIHVDHHAWYIHPENPSFMMDGNDGGLAITRDRGKSWRFVENLPVGQFYHINVDNEIPYNVYGGMQDNGSWRGPAYTWRNGGIRNSYFEELSFGDGFDVVPDPADSRYGYTMWQGGNLMRYDYETGAQAYMKPIHPEKEELRFNWNSAIALDPANPATVYYGSQYLFKSTDKGTTWEVISPDLTTNDPEKAQLQKETGGLTYDVTQAENHMTIVSIAPSQVEAGVIWAGTDDGNLQLTKDGGATWENVIGNIKEVPKGSWITQIKASTQVAGEAYVVINNYRRNDWTPWLYKTTDFGKSWTRLVDENDVWGYCLSFVQDSVEPKLLFLGTEFGLYFSIDAGENWNKWGKDYPTVSTMDMTIHPREYDLVIGTFGRSIWVLDDIRPLRALASEGENLLSEKVHVYEAPDAYLAYNREAAGVRFGGNATFAGENRKKGALITFSLKELIAKEDGEEIPEKDSVDVSIMNDDGTMMRSLKMPAVVGMNRFYWELDRAGVRSADTPKKKDAPQPGGIAILPGNYTVKVSYNDASSETIVKVHPDPRYDIPMTEMVARYKTVNEVLKYSKLATEATDQLREAKETIALVKKQYEEKEEAKEVIEKGTALNEKIDALLQTIIPPKDAKGIVYRGNLLSTKIGSAMGYLQGNMGAVNETEKLAVVKAEKALKVTLSPINTFFEQEWNPYQEKVKAIQAPVIKEYKAIDVGEE
ncbi:MAG: hypothetical protein AAGI07_00940 [Bacteroidota bacterium]